MLSKVNQLQWLNLICCPAFFLACFNTFGPHQILLCSTNQPFLHCAPVFSSAHPPKTQGSHSSSFLFKPYMRVFLWLIAFASGPVVHIVEEFLFPECLDLICPLLTAKSFFSIFNLNYFFIKIFAWNYVYIILFSTPAE